MTETVLIRGGRFELRECITCGVMHAMPAVLLDQDRSSGGYRFCPNGHQQGWSKEDSEETKIRRERDVLKQQIAQRDDMIVYERRQAEEARRQVEQAKKESKRLAKRAAAGVCPCCTRTVGQLARHMKTKHPEFVATEATNVVAMKKKA